MEKMEKNLKVKYLKALIRNQHILLQLVLCCKLQVDFFISTIRTYVAHHDTLKVISQALGGLTSLTLVNLNGCGGLKGTLEALGVLASLNKLILNNYKGLKRYQRRCVT